MAQEAFAHLDEINGRMEIMHKVTNSMNASNDAGAQWLADSLSLDRVRGGIGAEKTQMGLADLVTQRANQGWSIG